MTGRYAGFVVTLADNIREDDAETVVSAIGMLKGVVSVAPVHVSSEMVIAEARARSDVRRKLLTLVEELTYDR